MTLFACHHIVCLESVKLEVLLLAQLLEEQELTHVLPLVALQLNDLPELLVLHNVSVARELCGPSMIRSRWRSRGQEKQRAAKRPGLDSSIESDRKGYMTHLSSMP